MRRRVGRSYQRRLFNLLVSYAVPEAKIDSRAYPRQAQQAVRVLGAGSGTGAMPPRGQSAPSGTSSSAVEVDDDVDPVESSLRAAVQSHCPSSVGVSLTDGIPLDDDLDGGCRGSIANLGDHLFEAGREKILSWPPVGQEVRIAAGAGVPEALLRGVAQMEEARALYDMVAFSLPQELRNTRAAEVEFLLRRANVVIEKIRPKPFPREVAPPVHDWQGAFMGKILLLVLVGTPLVVAGVRYFHARAPASDGTAKPSRGARHRHRRSRLPANAPADLGTKQLILANAPAAPDTQSKDRQASEAGCQFAHSAFQIMRWWSLQSAACVP